jgi:hypothetical protein
MSADYLEQLRARFWPKVAVRRFANGELDYGPESLPFDHAGRFCWEWQAARRGGPDGKRYGAIAVGGRVEYAHRIAFWLFTGRRLRSDRDGCHKCDRNLCCNPTHVFEGTHRQNMRDYVAKYGRIGVDKRPLPPRPCLPYEDAESVDRLNRPGTGVRRMITLETGIAVLERRREALKAQLALVEPGSVTPRRQIVDEAAAVASWLRQLRQLARPARQRRVVDPPPASPVAVQAPRPPLVWSRVLVVDCDPVTVWSGDVSRFRPLSAWRQRTGAGA